TGGTVTPGGAADKGATLGHNGASQEAAIDFGMMDGWGHVPGCTAATRYGCISGYTPGQVPNLAALASRFAISDQTFSMADSPSWGGHLYAVMASIDGFVGDTPSAALGVTPGPGSGCDSRRVTPWTSPPGSRPIVPTRIPDCSLGLPNGGAFRRTPVRHAPTILDRLDAARLTWRIYGEPNPPNSSTPTAGGYGWDICPSFAECL